MNKFNEVTKKIVLHDSQIISLKINNNGLMELELDFDEVWNKLISKDIKGLVFNSVYEISEFKIDRFNVISSVEATELEDYNKDFVIHDSLSTLKTLLINFELVAGGNLLIVCSDSVEYLYSR
jgi:hypothetical protein